MVESAYCTDRQFSDVHSKAKQTLHIFVVTLFDVAICILLKTRAPQCVEIEFNLIKYIYGDLLVSSLQRGSQSVGCLIFPKVLECIGYPLIPKLLSQLPIEKKDIYEMSGVATVNVASFNQMK